MITVSFSIEIYDKGDDASLAVENIDLSASCIEILENSDLSTLLVEAVRTALMTARERAMEKEW